MPLKTNDLVACGDCDLLQREVPVPEGGSATCARCGAELYRNKPGSLDTTLALVVAAAILFVMANAYPLMGLDASGIRSSATLFQTAWALHGYGMGSVAMLVFFTTLVFPTVYIASMLYMLAPLRLGVVPPRIHAAFRIASFVQVWGMVEVFLLGALVSLVKLTQVAEVDAELGIYAIGGYVLLVAGAISAFEPRELWRRVAVLGMPLPAAQEQPAA